MLGKLAASNSKCGILFPSRCDKAYWRVNEYVLFHMVSMKITSEIAM